MTKTGASVGAPVGAAVGAAVGTTVGEDEGVDVGDGVGDDVGAAVTAGVVAMPVPWLGPVQHCTANIGANNEQCAAPSDEISQDCIVPQVKGSSLKPPAAVHAVSDAPAPSTAILLPSSFTQSYSAI